MVLGLTQAGQLNYTVEELVRKEHNKASCADKKHPGSAVVPMTSFLFLVNLVSWTIAHKLLNWKCFTIRLFRHSRKPADPEADDDSCGYQDNYMNPYIAMNVDAPKGDTSEYVTGWKQLSWVGRKRRQVNKYLPRDKILSRTFGKAVQLGIRSIH